MLGRARRCILRATRPPAVITSNEAPSCGETPAQCVRKRPARVSKPPASDDSLRFIDASTLEKVTKRSVTKVPSATLQEPVAPHANLNEHLTRPLEELGLIEKNRGESHKHRAYAKAVNSLRIHPTRILSGEEAKKLPGVGHKIATKIQQILDTNGQLRQLDEAKLDPNVIAMNTLAGVAGVGHVLARKLVYEDGIMSVEELKNVPGLHNQVQIGLKYYDDFRQRIPRDEMDRWNDIILSVRDNVDTALVVNVCGSYRRGLPTSGDVDILVTHPNFTISQKEQGETFNIVERIVDALKDAGTITDDISIGPLKYMGVGKLQGGTIARRIDIKLLPRESYYAGLLHFTGSAEYNRQMRALAIEKGLRLNEYGLHLVDAELNRTQLIPTDSEEHIFRLLGIPYRAPQDRSV